MPEGRRAPLWAGRLGRPRGFTAARPTWRGVGALGVSASLLALSLASATYELLPLVAFTAVAVLTAPVSAAARGGRARRDAALQVEALPAVTPVGGKAVVRISFTRRSTRPLPPLAMEGCRGRWVAEAPNPASRPRRTRRRQERRELGLPSRLLAPRGLVTLPDPSAGEAFTSPVPTARRGVVRLPGAHTWVRDPFGLFAAPGPPLPTVTVVVHPRPDGEARWPTPAWRTGAQDTANVAPASGRDGAGDLMGIRPYVAGDRLSLLHWPARARYGSWFVRQFAAEDSTGLRLVIDDRAGVHRRTDFEAMLSAVQGLVDAAYVEGRVFELATLSGSFMTLECGPRSLEASNVMLAAVLPRHGVSVPLKRGGVVVTTATGAQNLPAGVEHIVVPA